MNNKLLGITTLFLSFLFIFSYPAYAHCPLCTAAAGSAVVAARWYGIDDLIVGTFIGGFIISGSLWIHNILKKRNKGKNYIHYQSGILVLVGLVSTLLVYYNKGLLANTYSKYLIFGLDKLFVGTLIGTAVTVLSFRFHDILRKNNKNKNKIPFQGMLLMLLFLIIVSLGYYVLGLI